ncbi:MAG: CapA family protein [Paenibacillus sp.]|uniref:CapA family protein n=1 Tax=Paenibacillus sp. TaxID=58172 RepID=UPI00290E427D|nr:CapA family protein [Paenibacillus sp.]MDU4697822.1 CapA family protein [Paenibacillus sp.]
MYPPRSEKNKKKQQEKKRRQNRIWLLLNLTLITLIFVLGAYFYLEERLKQVGPEAGTEQLPNGVLGETASNESDPSAGETPLTDDSDAAHTENGTENGSGPNNPHSDGTSPEEGDTGDEGEVGLAPSTGSDSGKWDGGDAERLLIHFAGDTIFSGKVEERLEKAGYELPYKYVRGLFKNDDLSVLNLETPVTTGGDPAEDKTYVFKSPPKAIGPMAQAGVDAVNLANNHVLDQGVSGLQDTMKALRQHNLLYVGAGKNSKEAYAPVYVERKGIKIALFGFSRVVPEPGWVAGKSKPGVASVYAPKAALNAIQAARQNADLVLVMTHWGKERTTQLEKHQPELAHAFIDAGADLVIGSHPHVMQGLEQYKGKWIAYSTGNFIFTKSKDPKTWETAVFAASCTRDGDCELKLIPYRTELGQPVPMNAEDGSKLLKEIQSFSPGVRISEEGDVSAAKTGRMNPSGVPLQAEDRT